MDLGAGIVLASGTILLYLLITKTKSFQDFSKLKTLKRSTAFITVNVLWLLMIPGTVWYYTYRGGRGDYPPFADSIAIPIYYQIQFLLYLILPLNILVFLTTLNTNLPTNLFVKPDRFGLPVILWELFFGVCQLLNLLCLIVFVADGDHISIFVILYFTYIVLSLRAGQISRYKQVQINL